MRLSGRAYFPTDAAEVKELVDVLIDRSPNEEGAARIVDELSRLPDAPDPADIREVAMRLFPPVQHQCCGKTYPHLNSRCVGGFVIVDYQPGTGPWPEYATSYSVAYKCTCHAGAGK